MLYLIIPIGLIILLIIYVAYIAIAKKNVSAHLKPVLLPGLLFISVWAVIYYFIFK